MPKENTKNLLAGPDNERVVEVHEATKNRFADQETQLGMAGQTLHKPSDDTSRQALEWNPQDKWGKGRPRNTWRSAVPEEAKGVKKTWAEIKSDAKHRVRWRIFVEALCSTAE
jgi:hypothetical protein